MRLFKSFFPCLLLLASCSQESVLPEGGSLEIKLSGGIGSLEASASTRGVVNGDYAAALSVSFARVDQNEDGTYPAYNSVFAPLSATRAGGSGQTNIGFTKAQFYQTRAENNNTKLIGWYPQVTDGSSYADGVVTFDISKGNVDVMLTQELTGNKTAKFGDAGKQFTFNHLLTQVTVKAFGDAAAATNWGKITSIKVKGQKPTCKVTLPDRSPAFEGAAANVLLKNADMDMAALAIPNGTSNAATCGYALFPPTADKNLTLEVTTERGGVRDITVALPSGADPQYFAAGTAYTVTLEFSSTEIEPSAKIGAWTDGGSASGNMKV
ncbi:fimbrillin family protein [Bacteroides sp.]